jgi:hypothetical protein
MPSSAGMSQVRASFSDRLGRPVGVGYARFAVEEMSWAAQGGAERATIRAEGSLAGLSNLVSFLRYGVRVSDTANGAACWWGYVETVEIHATGAIYQVSLEGMYNRTAVRYRDENPLEGDSGAWTHQTAWQDDAASQGQYGIKEQVFTLGESRADQATAAAATYLVRLKQPASTSRWEAPGGSYARLVCRGWWSTLDWQFYREERGYVGNLEQATGGLNYPFGAAGGQSQVEQVMGVSGSGSWAARWLWVKLYRVGAPADNVICELASAPSGGVLASQTVAGTTVSKDSASWYVFSLGPVTLAGGSTYYLRLRRSGGVDANNFYGVKVEEDALLGNVTVWNGAAWVARTPAASWILALYGQEYIVPQIGNIAAAAQFLTGTLVKAGSGVLARLYRSGKLRMRAEMEALAEGGYSSGTSMHLWVNEARQLVVERRPDMSQVERRITAAGEVRHVSGRRLMGGESPVGCWAQVEGLALMGGSIGAPPAVWLEHAAWKAGALRVTGWEERV